MSCSIEIVSLGGAGGFGMNALLIGSPDGAILIDYGVGFPHPGLPGVEKLVPEAGALVGRYPRIDAVLLTHGHDDHVAALPWIPDSWAGTRVLGTPLALRAAADRFDGTGRDLPGLEPVFPGRAVEAGPFRVRFVHVTHSTPQSCALIVETPAGRIVHSGDFRLDPTPLRDGPTDVESLARAGLDGVRLLLLDSTGALRDGRSGTERDVSEAIDRVVGESEGQVFASTFSSHLHRVQALAGAARRAGRVVALLGRRLQQMVGHARDLGLLDLPASTIAEAADLEDLPERRRLWIVGGCQGELNSSLARLSFDADSRARVGPGDTVLLSASVIPGNGLLVAKMVDRLIRLGARVVTPGRGAPIHISGHGNRAEIAEFAELVKPRAVLPIHGDRRNLEAVAELTRPVARDPVPVIERGESLLVHPERIERGPVYDLAATAIDSSGWPVDADALRQRRRLGQAGVVTIAIGPASSSASGYCLAARGVAAWDGLEGRGARLERAVADELEAARTERVSGERLRARVERRAADMLRAWGRRRPELLVELIDGAPRPDGRSG